MRKELMARLVAWIVALHGLYILTTNLLSVTLHRSHFRLPTSQIELPIVIGFSLVYLSSLLRRRKRTAWVVTLIVYGFYLGVGVDGLTDVHFQHLVFRVVHSLVVPILIVGLLSATQGEFIVKSDVRGFRSSLRTSILVLLIAFMYGTAGFCLLDHSDFHREISLPMAMHYTVDQFNLTTSQAAIAYTHRAKIFMDSLSLTSILAVLYAVLALFAPLRTRFGSSSAARAKFESLLHKSDAQSEDFFKLWPLDKHYFGGTAYKVTRGVALALGDPLGDTAHELKSFGEMCRLNDWQVAYVHILDDSRVEYEARGFALQKLGEEAVVDVTEFLNTTAKTKYFRQISNKFNRLGFTTELLLAPHSVDTLQTLCTISDDWLSRGGRAERGFAMGYYTDEYMQQCDVMVARDANGSTVAFLNKIPATWDKNEATYDLLRYSGDAPGNLADFLLMGFMTELQKQDYTYLNMGLCPLVGLDNDDKTNLLVNTFLRFVYSGGDRFYSFSGLHRFKAKYKPQWRGRYLAYTHGVRGFSRSINALMRAMSR